MSRQVMARAVVHACLLLTLALGAGCAVRGNLVPEGEDTVENVRRIPILGSLPIIGRLLFSHVERVPVEPGSPAAPTSTSKVSSPALDAIPIVQASQPHRNATVAILTFDARVGLSGDEASLLSDRFAVELGKAGVYQLIPRSKMKEIFELEMYSVECSTVECAVEAGQRLGVEYMIFGSIGRLGAMFTMNVSLAGVEKGTIVAGATLDYRGQIEEFLTSGMRQAVDNLLAEVARQSTGAAGAAPTTGGRQTSALNVDPKFTVIGEVKRPGSYPVGNSMTLMEAIVGAGGFTDWANARKISITRSDNRVIWYDVKRIASRRDADPILMDGDIVTITRSGLFRW